MEKEKRKEDRYKIDARAEVKYGATTVSVTAIEISKSGFRIQSADFIEPGTKIEAVLFLKEPKRIAGEVKWVLAEPGQGTIIYKIGVFCKSGKLVTEDKLEALDLQSREDC
ncbi:MAG: PilZ domain-containing protein [Desulfobacterales bacterium]|nr:MAG: PilZ domain-containing protein [Desulfobacterales bacterium]